MISQGLPVIMCIFFLGTLCHGQDAITPKPQYSQDELGDLLLELPNVEGLKDSVLFNIRKKRWNENFEGVFKQSESPVSRWQIDANSFYASGSDVYLLEKGSYSNVDLKHQTVIAGLPISFSGTLISHNNVVDKRLSGISIEFDHEGFINNHREKIKKGVAQQLFKVLAEDKQTLLKDYFDIETSRQMLLNGEYIKRKDQLNHLVDSISLVNVDTLNISLLDSLTKLQKKIEHAEHRVDSVYIAGLLKWNEAQQSIQQWKMKTIELQHEIGERSEAEVLSFYEDKATKLHSWEKLMLNLSRFEVGSFRLKGSAFDVSSVPLQGISVEFRLHGYYANVCVGKEGRQSRQFPEYLNSFRSIREGRNIIQVKAGIGIPEKSHLHLVFSSIRLPSALDSVRIAFPRQNVLVSLESQYLISRQVFFEVSGSLSSTNFTGNASTRQLLENIYDPSIKGGKNMASVSRFGYKSKHGNSEYSIGFQTVGSDFNTLGNYFLLNNRRAVRIEGKQKFLQNRGQLKLVYQKGITNNNSEITPGTQQNQFSGELSFRPGKLGSRIWASYSPSFYFQNAPGAGMSVYQLNLVTVGGQWVKSNWMSMLQITNFSDESQFGDTSVVTGFLYSIFTQSFTANKYRVMISGNMAVDDKNIKLIREFNVGIDQNYIFKKVNISHGIQIVKRFYNEGVLFGNAFGVKTFLKKKCIWV